MKGRFDELYNLYLVTWAYILCGIELSTGLGLC
jgi:hypothetical protein